MTANGSAGNRDGFEQWVQALQRAPGAEKKSEPDITSALVNDSATHVQQIPKELIHRLRERETQGLLGVEVERTAVFKPPPELLARAKRMRPPSKPGSEAPPAEVPTAPPPEAAVPTVRPPPPVAESSDDGWAELDSGLAALKPLTARAVPSARPSRPVAPTFQSAAPRVAAIATPHATASAAPRSAVNAASEASSAPPSSSPSSSGAPKSKPGAGIAVARTVDVVKPVDAWPSLSEPESDFDMLDEPTRLRADGFAALLGNTAPAGSAAAAAPIPAAPVVAAPSVRSGATPPMPFAVSKLEPRDDLEAERTAPRVSGVVAHPDASVDDSLSVEAVERGASGRRWVVIAAVFLSLVVIALAALAR